MVDMAVKFLNPPVDEDESISQNGSQSKILVEMHIDYEPCRILIHYTKIILYVFGGIRIVQGSRLKKKQEEGTDILVPQPE